MSDLRHALVLSILGLGLLAPRVGLGQTPTLAPATPRPPAEAFQGTHGFMGLTAAGGGNLTFMYLFGGWGVAGGGQMLLALKGGVLLGRTELGVEVAPFTYAMISEKEAVGQFEAHGYGGYHVRISDRVSWPLRAGLGIVTGNTYGAVWLHSRLDLVGVSLPYGSWLVDLHLPSFRVTNSLGQPGMEDVVFLSWLFGASVSLLP
jgi:hypothetical protein